MNKIDVKRKFAVCCTIMAGVVQAQLVVQLETRSTYNAVGGGLEAPWRHDVAIS